MAGPAQAAPQALEYCLAAYQPAYEQDWDLSRSAWEKECRQGARSEETLRAAQQVSIRACVQKYVLFEQTGKLAAGMAKALCAQGAAGRERLAASTEAAKPPIPPIPASASRLRRNMGPLLSALNTAKKWQPDACWSGLFSTSRYSIIYDTLVTPQKPVSSTYMDQHTYYFHSPQDGANYRFGVGDHFEDSTCAPSNRVQEPEHTIAKSVIGFQECLVDIRIDLQEALKIVAQNGLAFGDQITVYLAVFPSGYFNGRDCDVYKTEEGDLRNDSRDRERCSAMAGWEQGRMRRATGKPVWAVATSGKTGFVDARSGRFYALVPGSLRLEPINPPDRIGHSCR